MKKLFSLFLLIFLSVSLRAEKFYIPHYSVNVKVLKNGELNVTETIDAYFTQRAHGIMRQINLGGENSPWQGMAFRANNMPIQISDILVLESDFKVMDSPENQLKIRIGNEFLEVQGKQKYTLKYHVKYAINHFADHSEFYWNLIGHYWATNIDQVDFTIELPTGLRLSPADVQAYTGSMGSQDSNVVVQYLPGMIKGKTTKPLASYQGMTLAFRVPKNYFTREDLGQQLSRGTDTYIRQGEIQYDMQSNGDMLVTEKYQLVVANRITALTREFPITDLPLQWSEVVVNAQPALKDSVKGNKLFLIPLDGGPLDGNYTLQFSYRLRGLMERRSQPIRGLALASPTFKEIRAALQLRVELKLPTQLPPSADSLTTTWTGQDPWNANVKPNWEGTRCVGNIEANALGQSSLLFRLSFPSSVLRVPDQPAEFYTQEFLYSDYVVHLHLQPDATIRFQHDFSLEEITPQSVAATMGIPTRRDIPEKYFGTEKKFPEWGPMKVGWFESGTWIEASDEEGWKPGISSYNLEGLFTPLEIPWTTGQRKGSATTSQYGWLTPAGDEYAIFIPLFVGLGQPVRRPKVVIHLPEGATATSESFRLLRYNTEWNGEGMPFAAKGSGNLWEIELDRPLRSTEWVLLRGYFPKTGFTGPSFGTRFKYWWDNNTSTLIALAVALTLGMALFVMWFLFGRDRRITIVPQFGPPDGITPAEAGLIWDGKLHSKDLMTLIPYWAAKGFIKVEREKSNFRFLALNPLPEGARNYEKTLYNGLFEKKDENGWVTSKSLRDHFYKHFQTASMQLLNWGSKSRIFVPGTKAFGKVLFFLGLLAALIGAFGIYWAWSESQFSPSYSPLIPKWGAVLAVGILAILFGRIMPKRGALKGKEFAHLLGFREFINTVEADRLRVLVDENPAYFDETLPYAIVMGLAKQWAHKFDAILLKEKGTVGNFVHAEDRDKNLELLTRQFLLELNRMHETITYRTPPPPSSRSYSSSSSGSSSSYSSWSSSSSDWSSRSASSGGSSFGSSGGYSGGGYGGGGGSSW